MPGAAVASLAGMAVDRTNELGLPIGADLTGWAPPRPPDAGSFTGAWTRLERLEPRHVPDLWREFEADDEGRMWTYLPWGPFADAAAFGDAMLGATAARDLRFYAIIDRADGAAVGLLAYLRIDPAAGSIEVGAIMLSPRVQRTRVATEAIYLLGDHVFELGYRRFEWKCDALNERSRRAATRYGFTYEGTFRQATVSKHRNRDTAWFSIIDGEWPRLRTAYRTWLAPENFDGDGRQRQALSELTERA